MIILPPFAAEPIFNIGSFQVTNTYINSTLTALFFVVVGFIVSRKIKDVPRGLQNFLEATMEFMLGYVDQVTGSRKKSLQFLPIVGTLFLFILVSNWVGILPGIGSFGVYKLVEGQRTLIPLFRPANTDLNMTLAMAVLGVVVSHFIGVATVGFFKYANKFIKLGDLWRAVKTLSVEKIFVAILELGVGLIEIISEVAKVISLSLRLFGNVFAGEVLLTVLAGLFAYFLPLPFIALELLVGFIQAVVFSMLVLVYFSIATMEIPNHHEDHSQTAKAHA